MSPINPCMFFYSCHTFRIYTTRLNVLLNSYIRLVNTTLVVLSYLQIKWMRIYVFWHITSSSKYYRRKYPTQLFGNRNIEIIFNDNQFIILMLTQNILLRQMFTILNQIHQRIKRVLSMVYDAICIIKRNGIFFSGKHSRSDQF